MTNTFKHKLLLGTALVAFAAFAPTVASAAVVLDANNNEVDDTEANPSSPLTEENVDLLVTAGGGTVTIAANRTVGETATDADGILALVTGTTLTLTNTSNNTNNQTLTVAGTTGVNTGIAALNIAVTAVANAAAASENLIVNFGGNVDLGTGSLTVTSNDGAAQGTNTATANLAGNFTGTSIVLNADTAVDGAVGDAV